MAQSNNPESDAPNNGSSLILDKPIDEEMRTSYVNYAMSVIVSRALPDVRDGLKPSQRRVIYTLNELNLSPRAAHKKSARVVGDCMGKYHPHGDDPIYGTLVRLAQPFSSRITLADGQGNWGGIDGSTPAAMRYTEVRMAQAAVDMVEDIDRETVEMRPNFDDSLLEPVVLPSKFPNLLVNGSQGIAVGMATSIPPHNLLEVCDAVTALIENPQIRDDAIMKIIPGPDFPTGGTIMGTTAIKEAYLKGRGNITIRGTAEIVASGDRTQIQITELPYQVTTSMIMEQIVAGMQSEKITGIQGLPVDRTKKTPLVVVQIKKGDDPNVTLNQLYKFTQLQSNFSCNMLALDHGRTPRTFTLKEMLAAFRDHRFEVIRKRTIFLRRKAREKLHLLEGLRKALDQIDLVVQTIRQAPDTETAREALKKLLQVTDIQAQHILDMKLSRLTSLEQKKIDDEIGSLRKEIADYDDILKRDERVFGIMKSELAEMKAAYAKEYKDVVNRRTKIEAAEADDIDIEDLIPDEQVVVTLSQQNYVKRSPVDTYKSQNRGGKGVYGSAKTEGDFVKQMFTASTHDYCLVFTSQGRVMWLKVYAIPEFARTGRGRALQNLINLLPNETVTTVLPVEGAFDEKREVFMATALGTIKKTNLSLFSNPLKKGVVAIKLDEGDTLISARLTDGNCEIVLATQLGQAIRFHENTVRSMGRVSRGVRGMTLEGEDRICSLMVIAQQQAGVLAEGGAPAPATPEGTPPASLETILTVCERGYGKRTKVEDYRVTNRGGKGIINIRTTERNGKVVEAVSVAAEDEVILMTSSSKLIRTKCSDISEIGRATQGVRLIRMDSPEDRVVAIAKVIKGEEAGEAATPLNEGEAE
ncbi:MAG TPA: DNA gyrase subunit A [Planctomycetota bacterium]|nr:DNA gyrase subunit A [Planctomycetota bacterium]